MNADINIVEEVKHLVIDHRLRHLLTNQTKTVKQLKEYIKTEFREGFQTNLSNFNGQKALLLREKGFKSE